MPLISRSMGMFRFAQIIKTLCRIVSQARFAVHSSRSLPYQAKQKRFTIQFSVLKPFSVRAAQSKTCRFSGTSPSMFRRGRRQEEAS